MKEDPRRPTNEYSASTASHKKPLALLVALLVVAAIVGVTATRGRNNAIANVNDETAKKVNVAGPPAPQNDGKSRPSVVEDSCWWPTCDQSKCGAWAHVQPCVNECQRIGMAGCAAKGPCCGTLGPPPTPRPTPQPPQQTQPVPLSSGGSGSGSTCEDCFVICDRSACKHDDKHRGDCFDACINKQCDSKGECCGKTPPPVPAPPPGPGVPSWCPVSNDGKPDSSTGGWYTIGGTTTDGWCAGNCPNSVNPHCGDGIWCCGGSTHTKGECMRIRRDRCSTCGDHSCYSSCFYIDHTGRCDFCTKHTGHCVRKLW